jgi:hypothetical protein
MWVHFDDATRRYMFNSRYKKKTNPLEMNDNYHLKLLGDTEHLIVYLQRKDWSFFFNFKTMDVLLFIC